LGTRYFRQLNFLVISFAKNIVGLSNGKGWDV
jgi:hypothetical protein